MKRKLNCVLLVDDDHITNYMNLRLIKGLEMASHIQVAMNGAEAIAFLQSKKGRALKPDLIFLDINMPVMDGFEFMEEYNRMKADLQLNSIVCVLTTSTNITDRTKAEELKLGIPVNKPLIQAAVLQVIDQFFLDERNLQDAEMLGKATVGLNNATSQEESLDPLLERLKADSAEIVIAKPESPKGTGGLQFFAEPDVNEASSSGN